MLKRILVTLIAALLLFLPEVAWAQVGLYTVTGEKVNVRSGPGTNYGVMTTRNAGDTVTVISIYDTNWACIEFGTQHGFVNRQYITYKGPVGPHPGPLYEDDPITFKSVMAWIWKVLRVILIVIVVLIVFAFKEEILQIVLGSLMFYLIGGTITYLIFHNFQIGGLIALGLVGIVIFRWAADELNPDIGGNIIGKILWFIYFIVSLVPYLLNRFQHFLASPWRYFIKRNRFPDKTREFLRPFFGVLTIPLYIVLTPLRLLNAIYYNIIVHCLAGLYDFLLEVLAPCSREEGSDSVGKWILMFPERFGKYFLIHGSVLIIESVVWTVIDIFIPAVTLYHGTDLTAGQSIVGCRKRNNYLKATLDSRHGTFCASDDSWAGIGVYFASRRRVANDYAKYRKLSDNNPVTIVCRVSLGKTLNIDTAPWFVCNAIGRYGKPSTLNHYSDEHGYVTCEWFNGSYWEYCLFDWQSLYNSRWRIRPLYLYNHRTNLIQHIKGGMAHWTVNF